jgi:putative component of toxin-antitoxin plasmid stabilization module
VRRERLTPVRIGAVAQCAALQDGVPALRLHVGPLRLFLYGRGALAVFEGCHARRRAGHINVLVRLLVRITQHVNIQLASASARVRVRVAVYLYTHGSRGRRGARVR